MKNQFAVFGNPIKHSLSPQIHQNFAEQHGHHISYEKLLSTETDFTNDVKHFFDRGGDGCNVTVPFKEQAFSLCTYLTDAASRAQSVNTLYQSESGEFHGHNTDGAGLLSDLVNNLKIGLKRKHIIIIGAGGATRGILQPLIEQAPSGITLINRTLSKAETLAREFQDLFDITPAGNDSKPPSTAPDLLINATSASLSSQLPISDTGFIGKQTVCYDLAYAKKPTLFLQWSKDCGCCQSHDGRGMLVEQAALAYTTWTGCKVSTENILKNFTQIEAG